MSVSPGSPYTALPPLNPAAFRQVWLETVLGQFKWDPQIGDTAVLCDFPLLLTKSAWHDLQAMASALAEEAFAVETELLNRPDLHPTLGLPGKVMRAWRSPSWVNIRTDGDVRLIRFDFHYTTEGWRISEANIDTPGGLIEASGFSRLMAEHYPGARLSGDPAALLARAIRERVPPGGLVALIHATAYTDDRQMMIYLAPVLEREGLRACLISPAQLRWHSGQAEVVTDWQQSEAAYLFRFFPAEWLPNLPRACRWERYFDDCQVPASNPTSAVLLQSKRFPLVWDRLATPIPFWRRLLSETIDPRDRDDLGNHDWVLKPAFGRAGEGVMIRGVSAEKDWNTAFRAARKRPGRWIAQRRFETVPVTVNGQSWFPCIGVYFIGGQVAGIYGRVASNPVINDAAKDIAILIEE
jgi:glutathionylspermidine synthase